MSFRILNLCVLLFAALTWGHSALGQSVPGAIAYQGKLTDSSGQPVPDGLYQAQFKLYTLETGGREIWASEPQKIATSGGTFTTALEGGTPMALPESLSDKTDVWLEVLVGSPPVVLSPRVKLVSAPFAFRADDLTLPFSGIVSGSSPGLSITHSTSGNLGSLGSSDAGVYGRGSGGGGVKGEVTEGSNSAVVGLNSGFGFAGEFRMLNASSGASALYATTSGNGHGLLAYVEGSGHAVSAGHAGIGNAVRGYTSGTGKAGSFTINNSSSTNNAVYASTNGPGYALLATSSHASANAGRFEGNIHVTGTVTSGSSSVSMPIAYAHIGADGTKLAGTPNVESTWYSQGRYYVITISGEYYDNDRYVTVVTAVGSISMEPVFAAASQFNDKLTVVCFDLSGTRVQRGFSFITYKP